LVSKNLLEPLSIIFTQIRIGATFVPWFPKLTEGSAVDAGLQRFLCDGVLCGVVSNDISDEADDLSATPVKRLCPEISALELGEVPR
jgi:hypothetical protein